MTVDAMTFPAHVMEAGPRPPLGPPGPALDRDPRDWREPSKEKGVVPQE